MPDSVRHTEGSEGDVDEFNMLTTDMDAAIERAMALPDYVLPEQDDILKANAFRFVYTYLGFLTFIQSNQIRYLSLALHILQA